MILTALTTFFPPFATVLSRSTVSRASVLFRSRILALALVLVCGSAQAQTAVTPVTGDTSVVVRRGQSLLGIAASLLEASDHYTTSELAVAMRSLNELQSDRLMPGQVLQIPLRQLSDTPELPRIVDPRPARGIYATAAVAGSPRMMILA